MRKKQEKVIKPVENRLQNQKELVEKDPITAQSRIEWTPSLIEIAELLSSIEKSHFVDRFVHGISFTSLKTGCVERLGIQNRYLNAIEFKLNGVVDSYKSNLDRRILSAQRKIDKINSIRPKFKNINYYNDQILKTQNKLNRLKNDKLNKIIRICFGSKQLFHKQFHLKENGIASHEEWLTAWQFERNNSFFVIGSHDETSGNQLCQINIDLTQLKLRVPYKLEAKYGKYITIPVLFKHNREHIESALKNKQSISYLFYADPCGKAYAYATVDRIKVDTISDRKNGALCLDINEDHLALRLIDEYGNPIGSPNRIEFDLRWKRTNQAKALIEQTVIEVVDIAILHKVPIAFEELDFEKKKDDMIGLSKRMKRMLSSLAYNKISEALRSRAQKKGIETIQKNPAYTSIIGKANWSSVLGTSNHDGATIAIGRRALGFEEKPKRHVSKVLPVRNRALHVWRYWSEVRKEFIKNPGFLINSQLASEAASRKTGVLRWRAKAPPAATARRASERLETS